VHASRRFYHNALGRPRKKKVPAPTPQRSREGGSECTVGTRVGATVGRGGGNKSDAHLSPSPLLQIRRTSVSLSPPLQIRRASLSFPLQIGHTCHLRAVQIGRASLPPLQSGAQVLARTKAYHGVTGLAASCSGLPALHTGPPPPHFLSCCLLLRHHRTLGAVASSYAIGANVPAPLQPPARPRPRRAEPRARGVRRLREPRGAGRAARGFRARAVPPLGPLAPQPLEPFVALLLTNHHRPW
jgi:hypothetical protein